MKNKKIFLMGTRGIPAAYGGFETFAENLSTRLVVKGYEVTVFCRKYFGEVEPSLREFKGVKLAYTYTAKQKFLDTPLAALSSFLNILFAKNLPDAILLCNAANSPFSFFAVMRGVPVITNVDGIERKRAKWNVLGQIWYLLGEISACLFSKTIVADAKIIEDYYKTEYGITSKIITYGCEPEIKSAGEVLEKFNLEAKKYILYVSRLEPENNCLGVIQAYVALKNPNMPLVVVGDAPYSDEYKAKLRATANSNVIFAGFQFGDAYKELRSNCYFYVQATEVGGTHPALVEAMAYGNAIIANDVPEHREVLTDCGVYYEKNNFEQLSKAMENFLTNPNEASQYANLAKSRAAKVYTWEAICRQYEEVF